MFLVFLEFVILNIDFVELLKCVFDRINEFIFSVCDSFCDDWLGEVGDLELMLYRWRVRLGIKIKIMGNENIVKFLGNGFFVWVYWEGRWLMM